MKKLIRWTCLALLLTVLFRLGSLMADKTQLREHMIRLHVVANSDSEEDQAQKLLVRDAIVEAVQADLQEVQDLAQAKAYLQGKLSELETIANRVLREAGSTAKAKVCLALENFGTRLYDTFSLPAGIYESLRVTIGEGNGKNWWCVVFPSLCVPATPEAFQDAAVSAGFSQELSQTLTGTQGYQVRFFFLDVLGKVENFLFRK